MKRIRHPFVVRFSASWRTIDADGNDRPRAPRTVPVDCGCA
jgi:hypothetical protein